MMKKFFTKYLVTKNCYHFVSSYLPFVGISAFILLFIGLYLSLVATPPDYQQGDAVRIMYIHVPSAYTAMLVYSVMALMALIYLIWRIKLAAMCLSASLGIGAWFAFLALYTGAVWGYPMWGTWWIWDARLTSALVLFFIYLGLIALKIAYHDVNKSDKAVAILTLIGVINLPIIHYSVIWWNTLHQGPTLSQFRRPSIDPVMLYPLLIMIVAFVLFYLTTLMLRLRLECLKREANAQWIQEVLTQYE
jgi:heme exporter protein C